MVTRIMITMGTLMIRLGQWKLNPPGNFQEFDNNINRSWLQPLERFWIVVENVIDISFMGYFCLFHSLVPSNVRESIKWPQPATIQDWGSQRNGGRGNWTWNLQSPQNASQVQESFCYNIFTQYFPRTGFLFHHFIHISSQSTLAW